MTRTKQFWARSAAALVAFAALDALAVGCGRVSSHDMKAMAGSIGSDGGSAAEPGVVDAVAGNGRNRSGGNAGASTLGGSTAPESGGVSSVGGAAGRGLGSSTAGGVAGAAIITLGGSAGGDPALLGGAAGGGPAPLGGAAGGGAAPSGGAAGSGEAAASGVGGAACAGCEAPESCWTGGTNPRCVAKAVSLPLRGDFSIDATEVTRAQYAAWLATHPVAEGQPAMCAWNTTFSPDAACMEKPSVCQTKACATHPQPCVDWCDAAAYCSAMGRRLCTAADWTNACSSNGTYAAGHAVNPIWGTCNDYTAAATTTVPVASKPGCQAPAASGFAGVFDMIGNVAEWVDDCRSGEDANDTCKPRGLSFGLGAAAPLCSQSTYAARSAVQENLGFRCCSL